MKINALKLASLIKCSVAIQKVFGFDTSFRVAKYNLSGFFEWELVILSMVNP